MSLTCPHNPHQHNQSRQPWNQTGASRLTLAVFGLILAAVIYAGYCIIPFYYYYFELHNQFTAIIPKADQLNDKQIRDRLAKVLKDLEIPAEPKDLKITRTDTKMRLQLSYDETFYIHWQGKDHDLRSFHFDLDVEGVY